MAAPTRPGTIERAIARAQAIDHDLIVVGGGIYGIALTLEAARRGLKPLLIERDDFGGATSWANLRILHGGLRYLQSLDLARFYELVGERSWFLRHFPDLVRPLPCLMPLYGRGLKRPAVFRAALALNDVLSLRRNRGVAPAIRLPNGRAVSAAETAALFPAVERHGLQGRRAVARCGDAEPRAHRDRDAALGMRLRRRGAEPRRGDRPAGRGRQGLRHHGARPHRRDGALFCGPAG